MEGFGKVPVAPWVARYYPDDDECMYKDIIIGFQVRKIQSAQCYPPSSMTCL